MGKAFSFDEDVAKEHGADAAVIVRAFQYWIGLNKSTGRNRRDNRYWSYNTYEGLAEQFVWLSAPQIRRIMDYLVNEARILIKGNFNRMKSDKTNWYAFTDEAAWIKEKSPADKFDVEESGLPKSAEPQTEGLFSAENGLTKSAEARVTEISDIKKPLKNDKNGLTKSAVPCKASAEISNPIAESVSPAAEIVRSDLPKSSERYQLITSNNTINDNSDNNGGRRNKIHDVNFDDPVELNESVNHLYLTFFEKQPHFSEVDLVIRTLVDTRVQLTRKVCWGIIVESFQAIRKYETKKLTTAYLLGIIEGIKKEHISELEREYKKKAAIEAHQDRVNAAKTQKEQDEEYKRNLAVKTGKLLERYRDVLSAKDFNEIKSALETKNILWANGLLIGALEERGINTEGDAA